MFKVKTDRKKEYTYDKDGVSFKLFFEFKVKEDRNMSELQAKFDVAKKDAEGGIEKQDALNIMLYAIRVSLVGWEGIESEDGTPIEFNEDTQKYVFDAVTDLEGVLTDLIVMYVGPTGKNSSTGAMQ